MSQLSARAFGTQSVDLGVDFGLPRPYIVTAVLAACVAEADGTAVSPDALWRWTVSKRTQGLLSVAAATGGTERRRIVRCPSPECRETLELDLDLEIFRQSGEETSFEFQVKEGPGFQVRLPTGSDQLKYLTRHEAGALVILGDLVQSTEGVSFDKAWISELEEDLERHDPLTAAALIVHCPYCGSDNSVEFDLEEYVLRELERAQQRLLDQVHRIARSYHWTEREILELPASRRQYYLERIAEEVAL
jgi:hypothetical protein